MIKKMVLFLLIFSGLELNTKSNIYGINVTIDNAILKKVNPANSFIIFCRKGQGQIKFSDLDFKNIYYFDVPGIVTAIFVHISSPCKNLHDDQIKISISSKNNNKFKNQFYYNEFGCQIQCMVENNYDVYIS